MRDPLPLSIIGTAGPSTGLDLARWDANESGSYTDEDVGRMARVIEEGHLAAVRINGAHVRPPERLPKVIEFIRDAIKASGQQDVRVLLDLGGPKIRTRNRETVILAGRNPCSEEEQTPAQSVILSTKGIDDETSDDVPVIPVSYADLSEDAQPNTWIKIDDGQVTLWVERTDRLRGHIHCKVLRGDRIEPGKGVNLIDSSVSAPVLTEDLDIPQLESIISDLDSERWPEFISLSFVKSVEDIRMFKGLFLDLARKHGKTPRCAPGVIAKIERFELFDCLEDVIKVGDQTGTDPLTFLKNDDVNEILGDHFPASLASVQQRRFRYGHTYRELERSNLVPSQSRLRQLGIEPSRVVRGLYALREMLRIMDEVDAVMYARGDLTVEIDPRRTAVLRDFFQMCARRSGVSHIIATDILPSLRRGTRITAAEGEAFANLCRSRPSSIMASNEIAVGRDPIFVVREIYQSVVYLLSGLFGPDQVQILADSYTRRNTLAQPDALVGPVRERVRAAIEMLGRPPGWSLRGLEDRAGMLEEMPAKIFVVLDLFERRDPFSRTPCENLVKMVSAERPAPPIIPVRLGDDHPVTSFLAWGVRAPVTLPATCGESLDQPEALLAHLAEAGATSYGERCIILRINEQENIRVYYGEVPKGCSCGWRRL